MTYNYDFELAAFFFLTCILLHFLINRQQPLERTRIFFFYLLTSLFLAGFNMASAVGCKYADRVPVVVNHILAQLAYLSELVSSYLFFVYAVLLCDKDREWSKKWFRAGFIPLAALFVLIATSPFTGWYYSFDRSSGFVEGPLLDVGYVILFLYAVVELILVAWHRRKMRKTNQRIIILYSVGIFVCLSVQMTDRHILLDGLANCLASLCIYMSMQNPGNLLDSASGRYNETAFRIMTHDRLVRGQRFTVVSMHLSKLGSFGTVIGYRNMDKLLAQIGYFLMDVAGDGNAYRIEPHTFAMIFADDSGVDGALKRIQERFREKWFVNNLELTININLTVAKSKEHFNTLAEMNGFCDYLMELAKARGANSLVVADESLKQKYYRISQVENAIRRAAENNSLEVYYQPIYSIHDKKMVAAEALARMNDVELGSVPPGEFIPLAEKSGEVIRLGEQIFEKCCSFIVEQLVPHPELGIMTIHVNLSVVQCMQQDMADRLIQIIDRYQVPPGMLNLELTERMTLNDTELMHAHTQKLGSRGVRFSLDDYGTGSSNCAYLIDYDFPMVKFDKTMIDSYFESKTANLLLSNEFRTLKNLGISIVAEGVETAEQVEKLEETDMNYLQGYFFAKPAPADEFIALVKKINLNQ